MSKSKIGAIVAAAVVVLGIIISITQYNGVRNDMISKETSLSAQYQSNQVTLSTYIQTIKESLGVADRNAAQIDQILTDAIKGRYDNKGTTTPNAKSVVDVIVEAYPDLRKVSDLYARVQTSVTSGRQQYADDQKKLLDQLRDYDSWRKSGIIHSQFAKMAGAPSDSLVARIGSNSFHGRDAEDKMYNIVLADEATQAYTTGKDNGVDTNPAAGKVATVPAAPKTHK